MSMCVQSPQKVQSLNVISPVRKTSRADKVRRVPVKHTHAPRSIGTHYRLAHDPVLCRNFYGAKSSRLHGSQREEPQRGACSCLPEERAVSDCTPQDSAKSASSLCKVRELRFNRPVNNMIGRVSSSRYQFLLSTTSCHLVPCHDCIYSQGVPRRICC